MMLQNLNCLNGNSEETPPKQVRLTELNVSRWLRKSLVLSNVRSKVIERLRIGSYHNARFSFSESRGEELAAKTSRFVRDAALTSQNLD